MTHVQLAQFQAMLDQKLTNSQRTPLVDHILSCPQCATRFKAMKALEDANPNPANRKGHPIRYALGVAAVMVMAISPYLSKGAKPSPTSLAEWNQAMDSGRSQTAVAVTKKILNVNYQSALIQWADQKDVLTLVELQNQAQSNSVGH